MRLPCVPQLSTKDGVSNKNARLTNTLKTTSAAGEIAEVRPGLVTQDTYTGLGTGLIEFDGRLLAVYDDLIYSDEEFSWDLDAPEWDALATYDINDMVWYSGVMWFSQGAGNVGNTPGSSEWGRWQTENTWDETEEYAIGDEVLVDGVKYYARAVNMGVRPPAEIWSPTPIDTTLSYSFTVNPSEVSFGETQTATIQVFKDGVLIRTLTGSLTASISDNIATLVATNWPRESTASFGIISFYQPRPLSPQTLFSGNTHWSGNAGYENYSWAPSQSSGYWMAI